ncbi:MAG TPA: hypothetical protein VJJ80_00780 [Patescibacteria group bacterium]|nr:hypothetical protein [Patescibacteria group bacterium]
MRRVHPIPALFVLITCATVAAILIWAAGLSLVPASNQAAADAAKNKTSNLQKTLTSSWIKYSNLTYSYSVRHPSTWKVSEDKDTTKSPAQDFVSFSSSDLNWGSTPQKKIENGSQIVVRILPIGIFEGYTDNSDRFQINKKITLGKFLASEYLISNIDVAEDTAPAEIKFENKDELIIIDGWFASQDKDEFWPIFEAFAKSFQFN